MQTSEYRHLSKREKKYLERPHGRRFIKSVVTQEGKELSDNAELRAEQLAVRREHCKLIRKGA